MGESEGGVVGRHSTTREDWSSSTFRSAHTRLSTWLYKGKLSILRRREFLSGAAKLAKTLDDLKLLGEFDRNL